MSKSGKELYVGSLSYDATEYDLEKLFSVSGTVTSIHLICDNKTGEFKGCGYVRMSSEAEAKDAIASLDGAMLIDRRITVSLANLQKTKTQAAGYKGKSGGASKSGETPARTATVCKPAPAKPAAAKPGFSKPESSKTGFSKTGAVKTGFSQPSAAKTGASKPGKR